MVIRRSCFVTKGPRLHFSPYQLAQAPLCFVCFNKKYLSHFLELYYGKQELTTKKKIVFILDNKQDKIDRKQDLFQEIKNIWSLLYALSINSIQNLVETTFTTTNTIVVALTTVTSVIIVPIWNINDFLCESNEYKFFGGLIFEVTIKKKKKIFTKFLKKSVLSKKTFFGVLKWTKCW